MRVYVYVCVQLYLYCPLIPVLEYSVPPSTNGGRSGGQNRFLAQAIQGATGVEHNPKNIGRAKTATKREYSCTFISFTTLHFNPIHFPSPPYFTSFTSSLYFLHYLPHLFYLPPLRSPPLMLDYLLHPYIPSLSSRKVHVVLGDVGCGSEVSGEAITGLSHRTPD